jgi:hypothetical protein
MGLWRKFRKILTSLTFSLWNCGKVHISLLIHVQHIYQYLWKCVRISCHLRPFWLWDLSCPLTNVTNMAAVKTSKVEGTLTPYGLGLWNILVLREHATFYCSLSYFKHKTKHNSYVKSGVLLFRFYLILIINKSPGFCLWSIYKYTNVLSGEITSPFAQPPTWVTRAFLVVWRLPLNLSAKEGPTMDWVREVGTGLAAYTTKRRRRKDRLMKHCSLPWEILMARITIFKNTFLII